MKFTVERDALAEAIGAVYRATKGAADIPILKNVLIVAEAKSVTVTATNMSIMSRASIPAEVDAAGEGVTVIGDVLDRVVGLLPQGAQVKIEYDGQHRATVSSGRSHYKLHTLPAADFPVMAAADMTAHFSMPAADLMAGLEAARFAIEKATGRFFLTGIFLHVDDGDHPAFGGTKEKRLLFVATNGGEFARRAVDLPKDAKDIPGVIIPEATVDEMFRLAKASGGNIDLSISSTLIEMRSTKATLISRLVDATYPNFKRALPELHTHKILVETKPLLQAIARLSSLGDAKTARASFGADGLKLNARSVTAGVADEEIEIDFEGPDQIDFGVKLSGLKSCIETASSDVVALRMGHIHPTMLINPVRNGDLDYAATFLSMKLDEKTP